MYILFTVVHTILFLPIIIVEKFIEFVKKSKKRIKWNDKRLKAKIVIENNLYSLPITRFNNLNKFAKTCRRFNEEELDCYLCLLLKECKRRQKPIWDNEDFYGTR